MSSFSVPVALLLDAQPHTPVPRLRLSPRRVRALDVFRSPHDVSRSSSGYSSSYCGDFHHVAGTSGPGGEGTGQKKILRALRVCLSLRVYTPMRGF